MNTYLSPQNSPTPSPVRPGGGEVYFGCDLSSERCAALLDAWLPKDRAKEAGLYRTKDWDVRHLHPVRATYLFCHLFTTETRAIIRAHINDAPPKVMKNGAIRDWSPLGADPISLKYPDGHKLHKRWRVKLNGIIRARQWADQHGVPYEFMVKAALRKIYFGQMYLLQFSKMPDPKMLNGKEMREHILLQWSERLEMQIQYGKHDRYVLANGCGHRDVQEHQQWILAQVKRKAHPHFSLGKFIKIGVLDRDLARVAFAPEIVNKALQMAY